VHWQIPAAAQQSKLTSAISNLQKALSMSIRIQTRFFSNQAEKSGIRHMQTARYSKPGFLNSGGPAIAAGNA